MAKLKDIKGSAIQYLAEDPVEYVGSWSSGGSLNTARSALGSTGSQTAAIGFGGDIPGSPYIEIKTEQYDGSSWTEVNDLNTGRSAMGAAGTYTAAIGASGYDRPTVTALVESWDGTNWTEIADVNTARMLNEFSVGTQTAALVFQGYSPALSAIAQNVEQWNGSSWTEVAEFNTSRRVGGGFGTSTAALAIAGLTPAPSNVANVESWNGSAWTETSDVNTARHGLGSTSTPYTTGIVFGGNDSLSVTESWDGSSWTEVADMATGRTTTGAGTSAQSALAIGGYTGSFTAATEEWTFSGLPPSTPAAGYSDAIIGQTYYNSTTGQFKAIKDGGAPIGTWSSGGSLNTDRAYAGASGTVTSSVIFGGYTGPAYVGNTETYDGTSFTEVADMNTGRGGAGYAGSSQTNAIIFSGTPPPSGYSTLNETWDGTSWTESGDVNEGRYRGAGAGTSTAALFFGGQDPALSPVRIDNTESWNGSAWTEVNDLNTARAQNTGTGIQTAALSAMGRSDTVTNLGVAEEWDGTNWTEVADLNNARRGGSASRTSYRDTIIFGGYISTHAANTESWNGSSWTELNDLSTARSDMAGTGSGSTDALAGGGEPPGAIGAVEEWTAADFEIKTMTTS